MILLKVTFIELEFALALVIAGFLAIAVKRLRRKKKSMVIEDDETHWI
jgi:hypothetical protein